MNMRTQLMPLLASVAMAAASWSVHAATPKPILVWCQNCTEPQMMQQAKQQPPGSTVYVADAANAAINAYIVDGSKRAPASHPSLLSTPRSVAPDPALVAGLQDAIAFYNAAPVGWHKRFSIAVNPTTCPSEDCPGSVDDVIDGGSPRNNFDRHANALFGTGTGDHALLWHLRHALQMLAKVRAVNIAARPAVYPTLTFADGSHVGLAYDATYGKLRLAPDTAQDSHLNSIPYLGTDGKIHNLGGTHDFSTGHGGNPHDLSRFLAQLQALQAADHGWTCPATGRGDNKVYTCSLD